MKNLTLKNIAEVCGGVYYGNPSAAEKEVVSITTDSRKIEEGCLFVPIVGARVDGHTFITDVMKKGALGTLSERVLPEADFPYVQVKSSLQAVKDIAEFYLKQLNIPVVGITGSVGKTSTKEMVASVLKEKYKTLKTQGNFNNELGLPLTIFRLRDDDEIAVLEMGISFFGEMTRLSKIDRPDTCVITNIGVCHLENLGDRDGVLKAKTEIFKYMKEDGNIILNGDDDKLITIEEYNGIKPVFFGLDNKQGLYADELESLGLKGMRCRIHTAEESFTVTIPVPGKHMVYNALAATAVGLTYGMTTDEIRRGIESHESISGRFHMIDTENLLIVDDCYNASPVSMKASLEILQSGNGRRVAILGDMGELGADEAKLHEEVGTYAASIALDQLVCVGNLCGNMARGAREKNPDLDVIYYPERAELFEHLSELVLKGDTVLVKASHFMHFEEVVEKLKEF